MDPIETVVVIFGKKQNKTIKFIKKQSNEK